MASREQSANVSCICRDAVFKISVRRIIPVRARKAPPAFLSVCCVVVYPPSAFTPLVSILSRYFYLFSRPLSRVTVPRVRDTATKTV